MNNMYCRISAAALAVVASLSMFPVPSSAQDGFGLYIGPSGPRYNEDDPYYQRGPREYRRRDTGGCAPRNAIAKASRYIREPQIKSVSRNYVIVDGYGRRGEPNQVTLRNRPDCARAD